MAEVEWTSTKMHYGDGYDTEPWAVIEYYPKMRPPKYYWWAHRPGAETVDGWTESLEDAQRLCEDVMFGETDDERAAGRHPAGTSAAIRHPFGGNRQTESAER